MLGYLQKWRPRKQESVVDMVIVRLLLQYQPTQVEPFLSTPTASKEEQLKPLLMEKGLYSALAQFYIQNQEPEKALNLWKQFDYPQLIT